ncbi:hypothetical protein L195_g035515, partial [Trifolium pratense]
ERVTAVSRFERKRNDSPTTGGAVMGRRWLEMIDGYENRSNSVV